MRLGVLLDRMEAPLGGAEAHTAALLRRALERGHEAVLATLRGEAPPGARTLRVPAPRRRPRRDEVFAQEGARRLREAGCDVVFAIRHALDCDVYLPHGGLVADALAAKDAAAGGTSWRVRLARALGRRHAFFRRAEAALLGAEEGPLVIAVAERLAARIRASYPACAKRLVIVPNGVDAERFRREPFAEAGGALRRGLGLEDHLVALLLAHDLRLKGVETAVRALATHRVAALGRPVALLVAGGDLPGDVRRLVRRLGLASRVRALGARADPRPLYAAADLLVQPTWHDPCSLVCLEALAMGLPVVTTPPNGVAEAMGPRGGIVLEEPGNADALAVALAVLSEDGLRARTAHDARAVALRNPERDRIDAVLDHCARVAARRA